MNLFFRFLKQVASALSLIALLSLPALAQTEQLDTLFEQLADVDTADWQRVEQDILREWSRSGSPAMDLLLERGRVAMARGEIGLAIEHLTALTDHAPEFAEGWNARATAFFQAGMYGPSIEDIKRTLALNPRHFGALSGLGIILEQLGFTEGALEAYRKVKAIHPNSRGIDEKILQLEDEVGGTSL